MIGTPSAHGGLVLGGTMWLPDGAARVPGVVMVGGSGPTERTNGGYFDLLREQLLAAGVAVLGYDKRGVGHSSGDWASATVEELAHDAVAAVEVLSAEPRVDATSVGIFGHSEGGWVALRAAALGAAVAHLVVNSTPAVSFLDAEVHALRSAGVGAGPARALFQQLHRAARAGASTAAAGRVIDEQPDPILKSALEAAGFILDEDTWRQLGNWIDYDPTDDLTELRLPTLAVYGTRDPLTPVAVSVRRLEQLSPKTRTRVFTDADHRICVAGKSATDYLPAVTAWCQSARARA